MNRYNMNQHPLDVYEARQLPSPPRPHELYTGPVTPLSYRSDGFYVGERNVGRAVMMMPRTDSRGLVMNSESAFRLYFDELYGDSHGNKTTTTASLRLTASSRASRAVQPVPLSPPPAARKRPLEDEPEVLPNKRARLDLNIQMQREANATPLPTFVPAQPIFVPQPPVTPIGTRMATPTRSTQVPSERVPNQMDFASAKTQPPLDADIGLLELAIFCPNWLQLPAVADRLVRNDVQTKVFARMHLSGTTDVLFGQGLIMTAERMKKQISKADEILYPDQWLANRRQWDGAIAKAEGRQFDLTANAWRLRTSYKPNNKHTFQHTSLVVICRMVPRERWPQGDDRGVLTQCLEYAVDHPEEGLTTRDWAALIEREGFENPEFEPTEYEPTRDHDAFARFNSEHPY